MLKIYDSSKTSIKDIVLRQDCGEQGVEETVKEIISRVKSEGDSALFDYTSRFDKVNLNCFEVRKEEIQNALSEVGNFIEVIREAKENIYLFHKKQKRKGFKIQNFAGATVGQRVTPLKRVGVYVPGGTASYPSTVLMNAVPAKIAGVKEIIMVTPPGLNGKVNPYILAAASIAGVNKIYKVGGAQAVAALAFGTESIPKVDKIVGPGNIYVATAKKQVFGQVDIDMIAGPSEILIIADETANAQFVAADMLSQAEHDKRATAILITNSETLAKKVQSEVEDQLSKLPRKEIAQTSIENNGKIILTTTISQAVNISNQIAPEHLELALTDPEKWFKKIKNAGSVFFGSYTPEAVGDYFAGPNHTLPTSGTARFSSALSVDDFVKKTQFICYNKDNLGNVCEKVEKFAECEGLSAHANAIKIRFKGNKNE